MVQRHFIAEVSLQGVTGSYLDLVTLSSVNHFTRMQLHSNAMWALSELPDTAGAIWIYQGNYLSHIKSIYAIF